MEQVHIKADKEQPKRMFSIHPGISENKIYSGCKTEEESDEIEMVEI